MAMKRRDHFLLKECSFKAQDCIDPYSPSGSAKILIVLRQTERVVAGARVSTNTKEPLEAMLSDCL